MKVYPPRHIHPFVMYCVNGKPHSSLLIESGRYNCNKYDETSNLQVLFVGERALDYGGPKRKFFRLLYKTHGASVYLQGGHACSSPVIHRGYR